MTAPDPEIRIRPAGVLIDRALACLSAGPRSTADLALEVLSLRGNPRAAAAAVFALLGADPRFHVDGSGSWSLASARKRPAARAFAAEEFVVVDVETTGGSPAHGHRVIEFGAVRVAGGEIVDRFSTLIDPGCPVPRMITSLTGISTEMLAGAPRFGQVADRVMEVLEGRVFVGHNATFDWRFVSAEVEWVTGSMLVGRQLCTLRLARKLLPHLRSRSLGSLADYYGIGMDAHHRALDDAAATARLLIRFLGDLEERGVTGWTELERFFQSRPRKKRTALPRPMDAA